VFNATLAAAKSKDQFKDTANWIESAEYDTKPDLLWQRLSPNLYKIPVDPDFHANAKVSKERRPYVAQPAWPWVVLAAEVKRMEGESGFHFSTEGFLRESIVGIQARVQQNIYALEIQNRQHRTHAFTFLIAGKYARLFRWDRAGCLVSKPINLMSEPQHLLNFIYRLSRGGRTMQGFDPTATLASKAEIDQLRAYKPANWYLQGYRALMLHPESMELFPIHKVCSYTLYLLIGQLRQ
jgi:hypothetical protein